MKLPILYYDLVNHPMLEEIKVLNTNSSKIPVYLYYDLSSLIGKRVKHFKRDIVNDENVLRYIYIIKDFVLDANDPAKILVIYSTVYPEYICENKTWARELREFFSKVDKEKYPYSKEEYRFIELSNEEWIKIKLCKRPIEYLKDKGGNDD